MHVWKIWVLGLGLGLLAGGSAAAALGSAEWKNYRSDLIRCADARDIGIPACGAAVGEHPLRKGKVMISRDSIIAQVIGAAPETLYLVEFIPLRNTGVSSDGPYEGQEPRFVGELTTNRLGTGTLRTDNDDIVGPQLGYFLISSLGLLGPLSSDPISAQSHLDESQFVTGFDPDFIEA